jgi:hypothetical protein
MSVPPQGPRRRPAWLSALARALLAAAVSRMSPARRPWGQAMLAELDQARTAAGALAWALGGVRVAWRDRHHRMPRAARRGGWPSVTARVAVGVGLLGHALVGPLVLAMAGLVAPPWVLVALAVLWGGLLVAALRARHARPWLVPAVPVLTIVVGYAVVSFGMGVLGWLP